MKIQTEFNVNREVTRVKNTLAKLDWYISQGYNPRLPDGINEDSTEEEIKAQITAEFDEGKYRKVEQQITGYFSEIQDKLSEKITLLSKDIPEHFLIYLTNYGVGGSYSYPSTIIFNTNNKQGVKTLAHEIIHLVMEQKIKKHNIQHWEKERIIDLILHSNEFNFLNYDYWQKDYHGTEKYIDSLFEELFFENQDKFFMEISK